jgi:hypothetical protein
MTDLALDDAGHDFGGWREVLVAEAEVARARELLPREE